MANLIITIIAIALVAVMAIAGAWYGSSAFTEAQAKAYANGIVRGGKQVVGALLSRRGMMGAQTPLSANDTDMIGGFTGLSPDFLSAFPSLPSAVADTSGVNGNTIQNGWRITMTTVTDGAGVTLGFKTFVQVILMNTALAMKVCEAVNTAQGLPSAAPPSLYPSSAADPGYYNWWTNYGSKYRVHCSYRDPDNSGTYSYVANSEYLRIYFLVN